MLNSVEKGMHESCRMEIPNGMNPTKKDQQLKDRPRFSGGGGCATMLQKA